MYKTTLEEIVDEINVKREDKKIEVKATRDGYRLTIYADKVYEFNYSDEYTLRLSLYLVQLYI